MSNSEALYKALCQHVRETSYLESTAALLEWDQQTKLPTKANGYRSEQLTFLAGEIHKRRTDPRLGDMIGELIESPIGKDANSDSGVTIRELKREYEKLSLIHI